MIGHLRKSEQRDILRLLLHAIVLIVTMPPGLALLVAVTIGLLSSLFGLSGLEAATDSLSELAVPMATSTVQLLLPVYFILVLVFCRCWEIGTGRAFELANKLVHDLLCTAVFQVLSPSQTDERIAALVLPLTTFTHKTRPRRERPQFVPGDNPPLTYC